MVLASVPHILLVSRDTYGGITGYFVTVEILKMCKMVGNKATNRNPVQHFDLMCEMFLDKCEHAFMLGGANCLSHTGLARCGIIVLGMSI